MAGVLIVTAGMGGGHDGVARELAARLRAGGIPVQVVDLLTLYPWKLGAGLRTSYLAVLRGAPWVYAMIYRIFFVPHGPATPSVSPAVLLAAAGLRPIVRRMRPDMVVSTFHLAGRAVGRLRATGEVPRDVIMVTEAVVHNLWREKEADLYLCAYPEQAEQVERELGVAARAVSPVVRPQFRRVRADDASSRTADGRKRVLISTGSTGSGHPERAVDALAATGRYLPVVLCGHDEALADRLGARTDCVARGWMPDLTEEYRRSCALVENAGGGLTCWEAFASGLPVVTFEPLPGHGQAGASALAESGYLRLATDEDELIAHLDAITSEDSPVRSRLLATTGALFEQAAAEDVLFEQVAADPRGRRR